VAGADVAESRPAPVIIIHSLAHALAALTAAADVDREIVLASAPEAGLSAGPGWFREIVTAARDAVPAARFSVLLDCGDDTGAAMAAIRAGVEAIVFTGPADVATRLAGIAGQIGSRVVIDPAEPALDLATVFFAHPETLRRRCSEILAPVEG